MAQRSDEIEAEIEATREHMGATVDALAYKTDVPTRTKEWLGEKKEAVASKVSDVTPNRRTLERRMSGLKNGAERNPLGLAIGGAAVGFIIGLLTPSTRMEDERIGPLADEVKSTANEAGRDALERGKQVAQEAGETAMDTAKDRASEESHDLASNLQERAQGAVSTRSEPEAVATPTTDPQRAGSQ
jgi:gas vesicle protein